jgi:hypothetical protein
MNKEGFIVVAKKTIDKHVGLGLDNTQEVLRKIRSELNDVLNNYLDENEVYQKDFPLEFENEMGKWKIKSDGETHFTPLLAPKWIEVNITVKSTNETNKERYDEIINEVYSRYADSHWSEPINPEGQTLGEQLWSLAPMKHNKETFVNEIKCVKEFSEKWGLTIEERELNLDERAKLHPNPENFYDIHGTFSISDSIEDSNFPDKDCLHEQFNKGGIPNKLITVNYKNEKIEIYE